jgi:hypothetical protein
MTYSNKIIEDRARNIATQVVSRLNVRGIPATITGGQVVSFEVTEAVSTKAFQSIGVSFGDAPIFTIEEYREGRLVFRFPRSDPYRAKVSQESGGFLTRLVKDVEKRYNLLNKPEPRKIDVSTVEQVVQASHEEFSTVSVDDAARALFDAVQAGTLTRDQFVSLVGDMASAAFQRGV